MNSIVIREKNVKRRIVNRFKLVSCINMGDDEASDYKGPIVVLSCCTDPDMALFFPIPEEIAKTISDILNEKYKLDINSEHLGIYKTMIDSWRAGDKYLSGIIIDSHYDAKAKDDLILVRLALIDHNGDLDGMVDISFVHAMLLAAMEQADIVFSDSILNKLMPSEEQECKHKSPEDPKILNIVKGIMSGKIK